MTINARIWLVPAGLLALCAIVSGCKTKSKLYCNGPDTCEDPATPFCDLYGDYPASDGITNTCIPYPWDAGLGGPDAMVDASGTDSSVDAATARIEVVVAGNGSGAVASAPAGIDCGAVCGADFETATDVILTATPDALSEFTGWAGAGCSGTDTCTVRAPATVSATFAPVEYQLTVTRTGDGQGQVTSSPAGINCGIDCSEEYPVGQSVTLSAIPLADSIFGGWAGACAGQMGDCVVSISGAVTATAIFDSLCEPLALATGCAGGRGCYLQLSTGVTRCADPDLSDPMTSTGDPGCAAAPGGQGCNCTLLNTCQSGYTCALNNEPMNATGLECAYFCDPTGGGGPTCAQGPGPSFACRQIRTFYANADNVPAELGMCVNPDEWPCAGCLDENTAGCGLSLPTDCDGDNM